jgi:hypothetical protein
MALLYILSMCRYALNIQGYLPVIDNGRGISFQNAASILLTGCIHGVFRFFHLVAPLQRPGLNPFTFIVFLAQDGLVFDLAAFRLADFDVGFVFFFPHLDAIVGAVAKML